MAQPKIEGTGHGIPRMLYASDGSNWYAVLVDSDGHVKIDVVTSALPTDAATEATLLLIKGYVDALETLLAGGLPAALDTGALKVKEQSPLTGLSTEATLLLIKGYVDGIETLLSGGLPAALDSGALKVKEQSPLTGFATSANQTTMITALQLIDDLRAALGSVNTDDLQVDVKTYPGSNALGNIPFGYNNRYWERQYTLNAAAGTNFLAGTAVPAGEIWVVTNLRGVNANTNVSALTLQAYDGSTTIVLANKLSPGINVDVIWSGQAFLKAGDYVQARFDGCVAGDDLYFDIMGYKMKVA